MTQTLRVRLLPANNIPVVVELATTPDTYCKQRGLQIALPMSRSSACVLPDPLWCALDDMIRSKSRVELVAQSDGACVSVRWVAWDPFP